MIGFYATVEIVGKMLHPTGVPQFAYNNATSELADTLRQILAHLVQHVAPWCLFVSFFLYQQVVTYLHSYTYDALERMIIELEK